MKTSAFLSTETTNTDPLLKIDFVAANQNIVDNLEMILDYFEMDYKVLHNRMTMPCPIHKSSRDASLNIFTSGRDYVGNFSCWTNHCEKEIGFGVINLIKFLLEEKEGPQSFASVIKFLEGMTGSKFETISEEASERRKFTRFVGKEQEKSERKLLISREKVRESLKIPADYYIERGFSKEILDKYDVGYCFTRGKPMFMRCVVPCYDEDNKLIGAVGRSLNEECPICGTYHYKNKPCPSNEIEKKWAAKWINSDGFKTGHWFYNLNYARPVINAKESVILVEGQGDVWKLEESGIRNGLGLFGCELTDHKFEILTKMNIMNIYLALDNDEAGKEATVKINERLQRYYNVHIINVPKHDIGDLSHQEIRDLFRGSNENSWYCW